MKKIETTQIKYESNSKPEVIKPEAVYMMKHFMQIVGKGRHAMREARKRGLRVVKDGRCVMVRGIDYIEYLEDINRSPKYNNPDDN